MKTTWSWMKLALLFCCGGVESFSIAPLAYKSFFVLPTRRRLGHSVWARYGPNDYKDHDSHTSTDADPAIQQEAEQEFRQLLDQVLSVSDPQHIPSLLTKHISLLLSLSGKQGVDMIQNIVNETIQEQGEQAGEHIAQIIDMILSFTQDFVQEAAQLDRHNKELLGQILRIMSNPDQTARQREDSLDELLRTRTFSAGFLRHLQSECDRIANAPKMTRESSRLLETLRIIQTRVLEEAAQELGQAAQVLGQLTGYDDAAERMAVLEAGLAVRGEEFARELLDLTEEALEGFTRVQGGADPGLVTCIQEINERLRQFLREQPEGGGDFQ